MVCPPHSTVTFNYLKRIYNKTSFYMSMDNLSDFLKISPHQSQNSSSSCDCSTTSISAVVNAVSSRYLGVENEDALELAQMIKL